MTKVLTDILSPLGLTPTNGRNASRQRRGFSVTRTKAKAGTHRLILTDPEIVKALGKKSNVYVGTYANPKLAENAGKALINNKAAILAAV